MKRPSDEPNAYSDSKRPKVQTTGRGDSPDQGKTIACNFLQLDGILPLEDLFEKHATTYEREDEEDLWACMDGFAQQKAYLTPLTTALSPRHQSKICSLEQNETELSNTNTEKAGKREAKNMKRKNRLQARWHEHGHLPRMGTKKAVFAAAGFLETSLKICKIPVKAGGYVSMARSAQAPGHKYSLEEVLSLGLTLVKFEGHDRAVRDSRGRILTVIVAPPKDEGYKVSADEAWKQMDGAVTSRDIPAKHLKHKRGDGFLAINAGLSYGKGHKEPSSRLPDKYEDLAEELLASKHIQRLAAYQDSTYALWHPNAYRYYKDELDKLYDWNPELRRLFPRSIMPTVAFNMGDNVWTHRHIDTQNCPFGWCLITALGRFDHTKGGHIIIWDLGLVIEFPSGSCMGLCSALYEHSNLPVLEGDKRCSFTQYCPGEIFRFIENGFSTDTDLKRSDAKKLDKLKEGRGKRLAHGLDMFSTVSSLRSRGVVFGAL